MLLKHIYLFLKLDEYPNELISSFNFKTRYICNFLERRLRTLKFHAEGFSKICVQGGHAPEEECPIAPENAAVPSAMFDQDRYKALASNEQHEFFIGMLCEGLEKCARYHRIPLAEMMGAIEDFRRGDYKNDWIHQTKLLRAVWLRASLLCSLDSERFILTLQLESKDKIVFMEPILETKPDEIIFAYRFKEVVLDGDTVVVKNKFGESIYTLELRAVVLRH